MNIAKVWSGGKGTVKYSKYKGEFSKSTPHQKNNRRRKRSLERKETMIVEKMRKDKEEKLKNIIRNKYRKEAKEWEMSF